MTRDVRVFIAAVLMLVVLAWITSATSVAHAQEGWVQAEPFSQSALQDDARPTFKCESIAIREFLEPIEHVTYDLIELTEQSSHSLDERTHGNVFSMSSKIRHDYARFFDYESLLLLGTGFGSGAVFANTSIDREVYDHFQGSIRSARSDDWFEFLHASKELGNPSYAITGVATAWLVGNMLREFSSDVETLGRWGERSVRGYLVGVPTTLTLQLLTGGSRPGEVDYESNWRPLADDNGVSGHSFVSSLPFITAAKMTRRPILKGSLYAASCLGPLSRVNDNAHYPSQAFLGWWVAYVAASAVERTDAMPRAWNITPFANSQSTGLAMEVNW